MHIKFHTNAEILSYDSFLAAVKNLNAKPKNAAYFKTVKSVDIESIINQSKEALKILQNYKYLIIIGMGGAANNPKTILHALAVEGVLFLDTTDPHYFSQAMHFDLKDAAVLVTSNSGNTLETISLFNAVMQNDKSISKRSVFLVGEGGNKLRAIAEENDIFTLRYDKELGGRFSGFSAVCTIAMLVKNLDATSFLKSTNQVADALYNLDEDILHPLAAMCTNKYQNSIMLSYSNRLKSYNDWFCQIVGESLGKDGLGIYPIAGLGPCDQHSMLQLYLDGPNNSFFTVIKILDNSFNQELGKVNNILCDATIASLRQKNRKVMQIDIPYINEATIGELMMFSSLYVVLLGIMMNINPFDQPGVELIKQYTNQMIA